MSGSHSDDRIFEHPEVTIKPSALDEEIQKRLLTLKNSSNNENLLEHDPETAVPNILEHPDMDAPVIMLTQQNSNSSSALLIGQEHRRVLRQQSGSDKAIATIILDVIQSIDVSLFQLTFTSP